MSTLPRVSVVVLSHRFDMAIDAMRSVKAQSYPQDLIELRLHHSVDYHPQKFNDAARGLRGKYLIFLPDDDTLGPEFITRTVTEAERAQADCVITDHYVVGRLTLKWNLPLFDIEVLRLSAVPWLTFLIRQETWWQLPGGTDGAVGGWDGNLYHADWDVGIRLARAGAKVVQLHGEYLWNRLEHPQAASALATQDHDAESLRLLRAKHAWMQGTE